MAAARRYSSSRDALTRRAATITASAAARYA